MEIRGKTISYATYKKKQKENRELKLLEQIDKLEDEIPINQEEQRTYWYKTEENGRRKNKIKSELDNRRRKSHQIVLQPWE